MKRFAFVLLAGLVLSCGKKDSAPNLSGLSAPTSTALVDYQSPSGSFQCQAPAAWKAVEGDGVAAPLVQFFSPDSASISVNRYPDGVDSIRTIKDFLTSLERTGEPFERRAGKINGRAVTFVSRRFSRKVPHQLDTALLPAKGGFYEVTLSAQLGAESKMRPAFSAVLNSFRSSR
jgi:hypothetical protein